MDRGGKTDHKRAGSVFVGRERELAELRAALEDADGGHGRLFLISGEPGIGKTRLADELARVAASRAMRVAWGRCWEGGGAPAYWPWVEIVRSMVLEAGRARSQQTSLPPEIGQLIPDLAPEATQQRSPDPEQARFRMFDAIATLLKQVARSSPLVLILDDLHEADRGSLELLKFVARALADSRIVIVGTYREAEVRRSPVLSESISEIVRHGNPVPLSGLAENEVAQMIEHRAERSPSAALTSELHLVTAGNPLFVDGIIRVLLAERKLGTAEHLDLSGFKLPESVRGAIRKHLGLLSPDAQSALAVAAVIGQEFDITLLQRVTDSNGDVLAELMREASEVGIVVAASRESYRFTHPLIREALYNDSTDADRVRLHRAIGEALEQTHAANLTPHVAALAHHFREACVAEKAIDYSIRAGEAAISVFASEEAAAHWSAALELIEEIGGSRRVAADLHYRLGDGNFTSVLAERLVHLEKALITYEELADIHRAAEIHLAIGNHLSIPGLSGKQNMARAAEHLRRAEAVLSADSEDPNLDQLYYHIGQVAIRNSRVREAIVALRRSMDIAERLGHRDSWAVYAGRLASVLPQTGKITEALELQAEVWSRLEILTRAGVAFGAVWASGDCALQLWDPRGAQTWWATELGKRRLTTSLRKVFVRILQDAYLLAGDVSAARNLLAQASHASAAGRLAFYEGEWERADSILEQGLARARSGTPNEVLVYVDALARVRRLRCELERAEVLLQEGLALYSNDEPHCQVEMVVRPELALVYLGAGGLEEATAQVNRCRELSAGEDWRGLAGHVARAEGVVAAAGGRFDDANPHFGNAIATFKRYTLPWEEAETLLYWGRAANASGDSRANEKFDAAIEIYRRYGAGQRWIDRVNAARERLSGFAATASASESASAIDTIFRKEGDVWAIAFEGRRFRLRDMKGLAYIAYLIAHPGSRIHVCDLVANVEGAAADDAAIASLAETRGDSLEVVRDLGDAGEALDARAIAEYRLRLAEVQEELRDAERDHDPGRVERAQHESDQLTSQLAAAVGQGGRHRKSSSHVERARSLVTKNIRASLERIRHNDEKLCNHFDSAIHTGAFCAYLPDPERNIAWRM